MLIIVKEEDNVFIAGSVSDCVTLSTQRDLTCEDNINVWKVRGSGCVVGVTESGRGADLLKYSRYFNGQVDANTLLREIVPQIEKDFAEYGITDGNGEWNQCLVVACGDKAFEISSVFNIVPIRDFAAFGYGDEIAEGCLEATKGLPAKERIVKAFRAINDVLMVQTLPCVIIDSKNGKREIIKK